MVLTFVMVHVTCFNRLLLHNASVLGICQLYLFVCTFGNYIHVHVHFKLSVGLKVHVHVILLYVAILVCV